MWDPHTDLPLLRVDMNDTPVADSGVLTTLVNVFLKNTGVRL